MSARTAHVIHQLFAKMSLEHTNVCVLLDLFCTLLEYAFHLISVLVIVTVHLQLPVTMASARILVRSLDPVDKMLCAIQSTINLLAPVLQEQEVIHRYGVSNWNVLPIQTVLSAEHV